MGTIKKGINGPFKGKAGSVVGSSWKKINYIKGLQRKNSVKKIPSPEQAVQQEKFRLLINFLNLIKSALNIGFRQYRDRLTGVNAAFAQNYGHAFQSIDDRLMLDYPALQLSRGSLCTAGAERAWLEGKKIRITWNTRTYGLGGEPDDVAYAIGYSPDEDIFFNNAFTATRQDGITDINLAGEVPKGDLHVWLFFGDKQRKRVSNTVYIPLSDQTS